MLKKDTAWSYWINRTIHTLLRIVWQTFETLLWRSTPPQSEQTRHSMRSRCIISLANFWSVLTRRRSTMPSDRVFCSYISRNERYIQFSPSKNKPDSGVLVPKVILFASEYGPSAWSLAYGKRPKSSNTLFRWQDRNFTEKFYYSW